MKSFLTKIIMQPLIYDVIQHESCIFFNESLPYILLPCNLDRYEIKVYYFLHRMGDIIAFIMQNGVEQSKKKLCMNL